MTGSDKALRSYRERLGADAPRGMPINLKRTNAHPHPFNPRMINPTWTVLPLESDAPLDRSHRQNQFVDAPVFEEGVFGEDNYI